MAQKQGRQVKIPKKLTTRIFDQDWVVDIEVPELNEVLEEAVREHVTIFLEEGGISVRITPGETEPELTFWIGRPWLDEMASHTTGTLKELLHLGIENIVEEEDAEVDDRLKNVDDRLKNLQQLVTVLADTAEHIREVAIPEMLARAREGDTE